MEAKHLRLWCSGAVILGGLVACSGRGTSGAAPLGVGGQSGSSGSSGSSVGGATSVAGAAGSSGASGAAGSPYTGLMPHPDVDTTPVPDCSGHPDFTPCQLTTTPDRSYDICVNGTCVSPGCGDPSCNAPSPHFLIPPDDHTYFMSMPGDEPITMDLVTGLSWQACAAGTTGTACATGTPQTMSWDDALAYCDGLSWGGKDDWHLPDAYELMSIQDFAVPQPMLGVAVSLDPDFFPTGNNGWTTHYASDQRVFLQYFSTLTTIFTVVGYSSRADVEQVHCARRGFSRDAGYTGERFMSSFPSAADRKIIEDRATGLEWQGCLNGWSGADCKTGSAVLLTQSDWVGYCDALAWAGFDDWRLPTYKELHSIAQYPPSVEPLEPAIDPKVFDVADTNFLGTSSYGVLFDIVDADHTRPTGTYSVMCVRWKS